MDHSLVVRGFQGGDDLLGDGDRLFQWQRSQFEPVAKRVAFDQFHHDGEVFAPVDGGDVRMIQSS